jgi:hypothetical protein
MDFPDSPTPNQIFTIGNRSWVFINSRWKVLPAEVGASIEVSATPPSNPAQGDLWFDSSESATYVYYDNFWVQTGPAIPNQIEELIAAKGDLVVAATPGAAGRLPVGSNGQVLMANSANPLGLGWVTLPSTDITEDDVIALAIALGG